MRIHSEPKVDTAQPELFLSNPQGIFILIIFRFGSEFLDSVVLVSEWSSQLVM